MLTSLFFLISVIAAYCIGSVCSAVIVSKIFSLPDPRVNGSENPGATNVLRLAGKKYAAIVLLADLLKGYIPVMLCIAVGGGAITASFTALAAVLGHVYPVFFKFKGGKGVATALGALLALNLILGTMVAGIWLLVANLTRYSSLASIIAMSSAPFFSIFALRSVDAFIPLIVITFIILYKHRKNINRLMDGTEPKIVLRRRIVTANNEDIDLVNPEPIETITDIATEDTSVEEKS
ncbi:glycerol-3-phosphate 1-O-acyltransferase PlsY [Legionella yabuuchiae]|uniref:glycerol-3-phosphate 1-O-acyltransferase PlsY n=1 Tax=Legionella yabuuchiae TaxID=376727 RepID=UPI001054874D|nr:glycerol-3-phosphate 1-O-acyltransferase PlsY [Legionella yabuuchiae]